MKRIAIRKCLEQVLTLLNPDHADTSPLSGDIFSDSNLEVMKKVIVAQGVGPYLFHLLTNRDTGYTVSEKFISWLERLYEMNALRIHCLHGDLENILSRANHAGISIMPLKGSLLTTRYYSPAAIRPMADIDLLIKPGDFSGLRSILESSGYQLIKSDTTYANHHRFLKPNNAQIIDRDVEHPDNPRPVEVHTELRRPFFGDHGAPDLSEEVWKDSITIELLGQKAVSPTLESMFMYLAVHASSHLFTQSGRMLQLLDLAFLADKVRHIPPTNLPDRVYFPLILASRAFPDKFKSTNFASLEEKVSWRIKMWAAQIPLDDRCGLTINFHGPQKSRMQQRITRWKPVPWKIMLAYSSNSIAEAYLQYFISFLGQANRLLK